MGQFPPGIVRRGYKMSRIVLTKDTEGLVISALLDITMSGKVPT